LREVREALQGRILYAEQRLADDFEETFSLENLIDLVAPPGSFLDRAIGWFEDAFAAVRGVMGAFDYFRRR
jgi:hypothetical protein